MPPFSLSQHHKESFSNQQFWIARSVASFSQLFLPENGQPYWSSTILAQFSSYFQNRSNCLNWFVSWSFGVWINGDVYFLPHCLVQIWQLWNSHCIHSSCSLDLFQYYQIFNLWNWRAQLFSIICFDFLSFLIRNPWICCLTLLRC